MHEARIEKTEHGLRAASDGWFVMNAADMEWGRFDGGGTWWDPYSPEHRSTTLGFGIHVLWPGDAPGMYHWEDQEEGFLVVQGECLLVVEGEERVMRRWDYFYCPPGTAHITIGAGDGPCVLVMVGTRQPDGDETLYVADPTAAKHGHAVPEDTPDPKVAYRDRPPIERARSPFPLP